MIGEDRKVTSFPTPPGPYHGAVMAKLLGAIDRAVIGAAAQQAAADDEFVLSDETAFRRRFGFVVCRDDRRRLLGLKQQRDLTDREIRVLHRSGSLLFEDDAVRISAPVALPVWGALQLCALFAVSLLGFLLFEAHPFRWRSFLPFLGFETFCLAVMWGVDQIYIQPWRIKRRVVRRFGPL